MYSSKSGSVRRRLTPEQRQRLLVRFHKSQMTQRDFAVRHGIGMSTLSKWLGCGDKADLAPVKFREVVLPNTPLRFTVEVVSPQGWIVRLQNGSDVQMLPDLFRTLPC